MSRFHNKQIIFLKKYFLLILQLKSEPDEMEINQGSNDRLGRRAKKFLVICNDK